MKKSIVLGLVAAIGCMILTGCTAQVRPTISASEYLTDQVKLNKSVALYISDEFRSYAPTQNDPMDLKAWRLEIGPMAADAFMFAYQNRFQNVMIKKGQPQFPIADSNVDYVITPKFTSFKAGTPLVLKFENYWVELGMSTTIQDRQGNTLASVDLTQKGSRRGSVGPESAGHAAYPVACVEAVKPMVRETVEKTAELARDEVAHK